eukprot:c24626_g1_i6 orf=396-1598(+)
MGGKLSRASSFSSRDTSYRRDSRRVDSVRRVDSGIASGKKLSRQYSHIGDDYRSIEQVTEALRNAGLESSNLIVGIDFTKSNEWTGKRSFQGRSLHAVSQNSMNPYEQAIKIIGQTLSPFDDDNLIPCFGFGDVTTHDRNIFSFLPNQEPCTGFEEVLSCYKQLVPHLRLAGPTSFAPIIEASIDIVVQSDCQYHVLLIIADGQVTRSVDTDSGRLSPQEQNTIEAIVAASEYPLSIVLVGVGDGPWDMMQQFDDNIPERIFDNFQFVNFTEIMAKNMAPQQKEAAFALAALMEIPSQFKAAVNYNLLNRQTERLSTLSPLPPPIDVVAKLRTQGRTSTGAGYSSSSTHSSGEPQLCPVCWVNARNMAFNCGHQTCGECGEDLSTCPICRQMISSRLRLY